VSIKIMIIIMKNIKYCFWILSSENREREKLLKSSNAMIEIVE